MRILFDLRLLKNPQTGLARYSFAIISAFIKKFSRTNIEIFLLVNLPLPKEFEFLCELEKQNKVIFVETKIQPFSILQRFSLSTLINKVDPEYYFYPHFDPPIGLNCKIIFVVHDLLPLIVKNYISSFSLLKKIYFLYSIKYSIKNCYRCIAVSNTTKRDIIQYTRTRYKGRIFSAFEGCFLDKSSDSSQSNISFQTPYLLYVGDRRPHKNLSRVLEIFKILKLSHNYDGYLYVVGSDKSYKNSISANDLSNNGVKVLTNVSDHLLKELYKKTDALLFLSLYEGFGLPVVEAAMFNKKIIVSDGGSLPEIAPEWATIIPNSLSNELSALIISNYLKSEIIINNFKYISNYNWEKAVSSIFDFL